MKKIICSVALALSCILSIVSCGSQEKLYTQSEVDAKIASAERKVTEAVDSSDLSDEKEFDVDNIETPDIEDISTKTGSLSELEYIKTDYSIRRRYLKDEFSTVYESGSYKAESDIPTGVYVGFSTGGTAECEVYDGIDKENKLNDHGYYSNYMVIFSVEEGNFLEIDQAFAVPFEEIKKKGLEKFGIFEVGKTIPEGRYKLQANTGDVGHVSVLTEMNTNTRETDLEFCNRFYVTVENGNILILGNAKFDMPINDGSDDTIDYLISDDKWGEHYSEGCYRVGIDIDPGIYVFYSNNQYGGSSCVDFYRDGFLTKDVETVFVSRAEIRKLEEGDYVNFDDESTMISFDHAYNLGPYISHIYKVGEDISEGNVKLIYYKDDEDDDAVCIIEDDLTNNDCEGFKVFESQEYVSLKKGQYALLFNCYDEVLGIPKPKDNEGTENTTVSKVEKAFQEAKTIKVSELKTTKTGNYQYGDFTISRKVVAEVSSKSPSLTFLEAGVLYRCMGKYLQGYYKYADTLYGNWDAPELIFNFPKPDSWEELGPYVEDAICYITPDYNAYGEMMSRFKKSKFVQGNFDFAKGYFDFTINDLSGLADELKLTEEALGYCLAALTEAKCEVKFENNQCMITFDSSNAYSVGDEMKYHKDWDEEVDAIEEMGDDNISLYFGAIKGADNTDVIGFSTAKYECFGRSTDSVIFYHGGGEVREFDMQTDAMAGLANKNEDKILYEALTNAESYIEYHINDTDSVRYFFDENDKFYFIIYWHYEMSAEELNNII